MQSARGFASVQDARHANSIMQSTRVSLHKAQELEPSSEPEDLSSHAASLTAEVAPPLGSPVPPDLAATHPNAAELPQPTAEQQSSTPLGASILYTEQMLKGRQPETDLSSHPDPVCTPAIPIPSVESPTTATATTSDTPHTTDGLPQTSSLPSLTTADSQPSPSLVLVQMPGYGPEQRSFLVTPSSPGLACPSDSPTRESAASEIEPASDQLLISSTSTQQQQQQQQLALQAREHDPQAEVKMLHRVPAAAAAQPKQDPAFWGGFLNKCRLAYDVFFPPKPVPKAQLSGKEVVMSRLQMVLVADRCGISPETLIAMKNSTVLGLAKYMEADLSEMEMQVSAIKPSGKRITMSLGFNKIIEDYMLRDPDNYHYQAEDDDDYFMEDDGYVSEVQESSTSSRGALSSGGDQ
ncbi:MAG: hypothetical protein WDW36_005776 [Sanguina aurantia]